MHRAEHTPAFLLHQRPWSESGRVVELFTREHGRISVFAHGVRGAKARLAPVLQPFAPLLVSWAGRGESPRLIGAEQDPSQPRGALPAERLLSAWYVSELVMTLTARHDPQPELFDHYASALGGLRTAAAAQERTLRLFEKRLLDVLGYGVAGLDEGRFDDAAEVDAMRPVLRAAVARCLEGRPLRTRNVAVSLREFARTRGPQDGA
jgi:DNA repair protein RecO (recombination protein O)